MEKKVEDIDERIRAVEAKKQDAAQLEAKIVKEKVDKNYAYALRGLIFSCSAN